MDSRSFSKRAREVAAVLEEDLELARGSVGGPVVLAIIAALMSMDEDDRRRSLLSVGGQGQLLDRFEGCRHDGLSPAVALVESLTEPSGRRLMAAALGLVTYARLRSDDPVRAPSPQFERVPVPRPPPKRAMQVDLEGGWVHSAWSSSEEFTAAIEENARVGGTPGLKHPAGVRAWCLTVVDGREKPSTKVVTELYLAALRVRLAPWAASMRDVARVFLSGSSVSNWDEATGLWDELMVLGQDSLMGLLHQDPPEMERIVAAVAACSEQPEFRVYPGATEQDLQAAEEALGCPLQPHYRAFLAATNGMVKDQGRVTLFGVGPDAPVDVVRFNAADGWLADLPRDWIGMDSIVWFGATYDHELLGFDRRVVANPEQVVSRLADPDGATAVLLKRGVVQRAAGVGTKFLQRVPSQDAAWQRVLERVGPLGGGEGVLLGPDHHLFGTRDVRGAQKVPLTEAVRFAVELTHQRDDLADPEEHSISISVAGDGKRHALWRGGEPGFTQD